MGEIFRGLGRWQAIGLASDSDGVVLGRQWAPSQVAEKLGRVGKVSRVQKRLERWLAHERIRGSGGGRAGSALLLRP